MLCFASEFAEACTGDGRTYRIEPVLATLSTLPNRALLEAGADDSFRFPIAVPPEAPVLVVSNGILGVLWSSPTETGEKTRDPSDPSES